MHFDIFKNYFTKYLVTTCYMLGTVLGTGESRRNKNTDTTPAVRRILNAWGRESYHKKLYSYQLVIDLAACGI